MPDPSGGKVIDQNECMVMTAVEGETKAEIPSLEDMLNHEFIKCKLFFLIFIKK